MDCRRCLIVAAVIATSCTGCWRSSEFKVKRPPTPPPAVGRPEPVVETSFSSPDSQRPFLSFKKQEKRKPHPNTYVKWAEVRETAAMETKDNPAQKQAFWDEARKGYQEALVVNPEYIPAMLGLGRVYSNLGEHERANKTFNEALANAPKHAHLWYEYGMSHARFKNWPQAIQCFEKATIYDPENRHYRKWLGLCLTRAGRVDEGAQVLARVMGAKLAHYNVAGLLAQMGQTDQSRQQLELALSHDPNFERARRMLAQMQPRQPEPIQPVVHFEPAP